MAVFKESENYLEDENFIKISSIPGFTNGESILVWFLFKNFHWLRFYKVSKLKM